jgi:hypothetical protein
MPGRDRSKLAAGMRRTIFTSDHDLFRESVAEFCRRPEPRPLARGALDRA